MFSPKLEDLNEFAKLAIYTGVNVQKGQILVINAPCEAYPLVRRCAYYAYEKGASKVIVDYSDEVITRLKYENESVDVLGEVPLYQENKKQYEIEKGVCYLHIISDNPDLLSGIDPEKIKDVSISRMKVLDKYRYYTMNSVGQWSIIAYPNLDWAKRVFPDLDDDEAMYALWGGILKTSRVELGKTLNNWENHNKELTNHAKLLNEFAFKSLHYKNSLGTDVVVGLPEGHIWHAGDTTASLNGAKFSANIPTEEVFTMPDCHNINGTIVSTLPLARNGNIIPRFSITLKDGKIIDYSADENYDILKGIIETDEGSHSLGEVALISYDSPINNSGILFYNTLFDENASCHFAIGASYPTTIKDGEKLSKDELYKLGGNKSMTHVDFMVGSKDMSITGITKDDREVVIFENGNFVI